MGKKTQLTDIERGQIDVLRAANPEYSDKQIADVINRSFKTVR